jgi:hypothetical protein
MHLGTLMLLIAVIGVLIGVTVQEPVVGAVLSLITVPALIRTAVAINRHRDRLPPGAARVAGLFVSSFAVSGLTLLAAFLAFCVTCVPVGMVTFAFNSVVGLAVACTVGALVALSVIVLLGRKIWPIPVPFDARRDIVFLDDKNEPDQRGTVR